MPSREPKPFPPVIGFLTIGTLWGAALGYVFGRLSEWLTGSYWGDPYYATQTLVLSFCGAFLGTLLGIVVETFMKSPARAKVFLAWGWLSLIAFVLLYLLAPALQPYRE